MAIFLTVLKIIGITLLAIIGLLIFLLILVLFVPIRYRLEGSIDKSQTPAFDVKLKVTWLLHLLNIIVSYNEELFYRVRISLFTVISSQKTNKPQKAKKQKTETKKIKTKKEKTKTGSIKTEKSSNKDDNEPSYSIDWNEDESLQVAEYDSDDFEEEYFRDYDLEDKAADIDDLSEEKKSLFGRILEFIQALESFYNKFLSNVDNTVNKIKELIDNIDYYIDAINDDRNKKALEICINQLKRILKNIKPKIFKGYLLYGSDENPEAVGKILAISGIIYPIFEDDLKIEGDFQQDVLKGNILLSGRVTLFVLVKAAWIIYFNKDIKHMRKVFTRED